MKLRAIIIDDEEFARENLMMLLEENCPEIDIIGKAGSVREAREMINELKPEVLFLDIRMPSGIEGFELLDSIQEKKFQVVFVTAFKEYAIKAFNANATYYILKPIEISELQNAVERLVAGSKLFKVDPESFRIYVQSLENLSESLKNNSPIQRLTINHAKGFKIVEDNDIVRLEASGNCTMIHFKDQNKYLDTRTLKIYEEMLSKAKFCRIHKSHLINLNFLKEYLSNDGHLAIMKDGTRLPIARGRLAELVRHVKSL